MCGVVGISSRDETYIDTALSKIRHRGPDGAGKYIGASVSLGHCLLAITSAPKDGNQPYKTPRNNILVYNGEIFNYDDLVKQETKFNPKTTCDTELLAWGLDTYGIDFVHKIDSMHAFVYYDTSKEKLYLSRDHVGIKPLYYARCEEGIVFASEIRAVKYKVPTHHTIDPIAYSSWSHLGVNFTRNTFYKGIVRLLPGECMEYDIPTKQIKLVHRVIPKTQNTRRFDPEEFRHEVKETCRKTIRGLRKTGIFLSGGLDSSMITHEIAQLMPNVEAFSNRVHPLPVDKEDFNGDHRCGMQLAQQLGIEHHTVTCTPTTWKEYLRESVLHLEEPCYNMSLPMYCQTNRHMSSRGVVVTIAGDMGDEVLGGYGKYKHIGLQNPTWKQLVNRWMDRLSQPPRVKCALTREELLSILIHDVFPETMHNPMDVVNSFMLLDVTANCSADFFQRNDRFGMAFGMEGRFPLATKQFIDYAMSIPSTDKIDKNLKIMSKKAYRGILPNEIIDKPKTGWTAPYPQWINMGGWEQDILQRSQPLDVQLYRGKKIEGVMYQYVLWRNYNQMRSQ